MPDTLRRPSFVREFLRKPQATGALAPSSRRLANRMLEWLDIDNANAIVEYGPGTGRFTEALLPKLSSECRFFMVELNKSFAERLRSRYPGRVVYHDSVSNVRQLCDQQGIEQVDCVICGLPWASFPENLQDDYLKALMATLKPGGQFVTFAYLQGLMLPAGRRFRRKLGEYFSDVSQSPTVWWNFPPAFVYRCRK